MTQSLDFPDLRFVRPRSYTPGRLAGQPNVIVIHYTAGHEGPDAGEAGAAYDAVRRDGTSTHFHVDSSPEGVDGVIQCVLLRDEAHTARTYGNDIGVHLELAGTVQTREQWLDAVSRQTIRNAAWIAARVAIRLGFPRSALRRLSVDEVRHTHPTFGNSHVQGVCGHVDITNAFPEDHGTHTDPGIGFPWDVFLADLIEIYDSGGESMSAASKENASTLTVGIDSSGYIQGTDPAFYHQGLGDGKWTIRSLSERLDALAEKVDALEVAGVDVEALAAALAPLLTKDVDDLAEMTVAVAERVQLTLRPAEPDGGA